MDEVPFAELGNVSHTENSVIYLMCVCVCVCIYIYINYIIINFSASLNKYFLKCSLIFFFFRNLFFICLFLAVLGLRCHAHAFSSCGEWGLLFVAVRASHCSGFSCCGARALGTRASVVAARRLSICGLRAVEHRLSSCGARA